MPTFQMTAAYQFNNASPPERLLLDQALAAYRGLVKNLITLGGFELHMSSQGGKIRVLLTPYARDVRRTDLLGGSERFLELVAIPSAPTCRCAAAPDRVEITRKLRLVATGNLRDAPPVPLPPGARRPRTFDQPADVVRLLPPGPWLWATALAVDEASETLTKLIAPKESYLVALPHPTASKLPERSWAATTRQLSEEPGCVRLRCVTPAISDADRDYAQSALGHYLHSRVPAADPDDGVALLQAVMNRGPVVSISITVVGGPGLVSAVCSDLDPEALHGTDAGSAAHQDGQTLPASMLAYANRYLMSEAVDLALVPFGPYDTLPGSRRYRPRRWPVPRSGRRPPRAPSCWVRSRARTRARTCAPTSTASPSTSSSWDRPARARPTPCATSAYNWPRRMCRPSGSTRPSRCSAGR
ncbi:hypothetical protein [Dactylosporangium darangshiense]|uniref:hypothetical protein n=1 Tax=Dactylosporangium darangshiense TaxID=579108 RepID=UPI003644F363